jgi:UDP-N-acetylenolpyruvoylglucosamine reductase
MTISNAIAGRDLETLRTAMTGAVFALADHGYDEARQTWNLTTDERPAVVVLAESAADVVQAVRFARSRGMRIAPQGTGHGSEPLEPLEDAMLLRTVRMRGVRIDPAARIARAEAGALWQDVTVPAAEHGLAALAGSSPNVGVIGYTLGGGLSWLARKHGIGANQVTAVELVTADGRHVRADRDNEPDLFWAVRGGGGAFGVVTAIEFNLFPLAQVYAGILWFPVERAREVLQAWREWTQELPDEMTSVGRILQLPPIPQIPEPVRGKSFVVVEAIYAGDSATGAELVEPMRALGPVMDTVQTIPVTELSHLHMDPEEPVPGHGDGGMLVDVDDDLIEAFVSKIVGRPILSAEIRHLGGAVARHRPENGAVNAFESPYLSFAVGLTPTPEAQEAVEHSVAEWREAIAPWESRHTYMNFAETRRDARSLFSEQAYYRLRRIKAKVDPRNVIRSNHPLT